MLCVCVWHEALCATGNNELLKWMHVYQDKGIDTYLSIVSWKFPGDFPFASLAIIYIKESFQEVTRSCKSC
jgi:hypothetical protein